VASSNKRALEIERARYERQKARRAEHHGHMKRRQRMAIVMAAVLTFAAIGTGYYLFAVHGTHGTSTAADSSAPSDSTSTGTSTSSLPTPTPTVFSGITPATCAAPSPGTPGTQQFSKAPTMTFPKGAAVTATFHTACGDIAMKLDAANAPKTVASIVTLADKGFYDHTKCHRLTNIGIFVLQCGDPTGTGSGGPGYKIPDENLPKAGADGAALYPAGSVAMANSGANTGGSQFFLVYQDTQLGPNYSLFGTMTPASLKVVREIAKAGIAGGSDVHDGAPAAGIVINNVTVTGAPSAGTP
jgi:peptidyl-prolyl cis-trans isomerase B (cyclophilin B)